MDSDGEFGPGEMLVELFPKIFEEKTEGFEESDEGVSSIEVGVIGRSSPEIWGEPFKAVPGSPEVWGETEEEAGVPSPVIWGASEVMKERRSSQVVWGNCDSTCRPSSPETSGDHDSSFELLSPEVYGVFDENSEPCSDEISAESLIICELHSPEICGDGETGAFQMCSLEVRDDMEGIQEVLSPEKREDEPKRELVSPEICGDVPCVVELLPKSPKRGEDGQSLESDSLQSSGDSRDDGRKAEISFEARLTEGADRRGGGSFKRRITKEGRKPKRKKFSDRKLNCEPIVALEPLQSTSSKNVTGSDSEAIESAVTDASDSRNEKVLEEEIAGEVESKSREMNDNRLRMDFNSMEYCALEEIATPPFEPFTDVSDGEETETEVISDGRTDSEHSDTDTSTTASTEIFAADAEERPPLIAGSYPYLDENFVAKKPKRSVPTTTSRVAGRILDALVAPTNQSGQLEWIVKFKDSDRLDLVSAELIHEHFPQSVIRYLERRLHFEFEPDKEPGMSMTVKLLQSYSKSRIE